MDLPKLIAAAKEIDELAQKAAARSKAWQDLALDAKNPDIDRKEIQRRRMALDETVVVDFGTAIEHLQAALHAPQKEED